MSSVLLSVGTQDLGNFRFDSPNVVDTGLTGPSRPEYQRKSIAMCLLILLLIAGCSEVRAWLLVYSACSVDTSNT